MAAIDAMSLGNLEDAELSVLETRIEAERIRRERNGQEMNSAVYQPFVGQAGHQIGPLGDGQITLENVDEVFRFQKWDPGQIAAGDAVREALVMAAKAIIRNVPIGRARTAAINLLIDARMKANAAITWRGRF